MGGTVESASSILARSGGALSLTGAFVASGTNGNVTLASTGGDIIIDEDSAVDMNGGVFSANARQQLLIDGTVGRLEFGRAAGVNQAIENEPDYATGTAGNGITVNGAIATGGTGGNDTDEDGIELTATGGDLNVGGTLEALGGGINLKATNGAMTTSGFVYANGDVNLTSLGNMELGGTINAADGSVNGSSNGGALSVGGNVSGNDVSLFGSASLDVAGTANAGFSLNLSTFGPLSVSGTASGASFSATSYGGTLTVENGNVSSRTSHGTFASGGSTGSFSAYGPFGTVSSLSAPDRTNGAMAINGTVYVGAGEIDFTAGTTFGNDPVNSSITATHVELTAGTTATINFSRFHYGGDGDPGVMNVHAQTIIGTTDTSGYNVFQEISPLNLYATGAITLGGNLSVETLQGGNLTLLSSSQLIVKNLNTTGPTGAFVIGNSYFRLEAGTNANAVGPVTLDGSPIVQLNGSLAVAGGISTTASSQIPSVNLTLQSTLTTTGSIALGAGSLNGSSGTTVTTNSTLTTTGDATVSTLNAFGGFTVGTLSAGTVSLRDINGNLPANPPPSVVNGAVSAYRFNLGPLNTFTLGRFTAGALQFAGMSGDTSVNPAAYSLTLITTGNFGVGAGGVVGFVTSADFSGGTVSAASDGLTGGSGGVFTVTALPNAVAGTAGTIRVQDNGTGVVPVITSLGGNLVPVNNQFGGVGGPGGALVLNSAGLLSVGNGATVTAAGGSFADTPSTLYTGGAANNGGAGGTVTLNAGTTLTLAGGTGAAGTTTGPVTISAPGGDTLYSNSGSGGKGGTVNLLGVGAVSLAGTTVNAGGGSNRQGTIAGDSPGGTINVTSSGASSAVTTVAITNSTLFAANGVAGTQQLGTGGTINILSNDATTGPAPSPTPVPAVVIDGSRVTASQEQPSGTPGYGSRVGGTINVTSKRTGGTGISVQNSSQLLALANSVSNVSGGRINLTTSGADINLTGPAAAASPSPPPPPTVVRASGTNSSVTLDTGATGGTINVNNATVSTADFTGALNTGGTVSLTAGNSIGIGNASTLSADLLKIRALGTNGTVVISGGSILSAATQLKLYADGSNGAITFQGGNITLNTGTLAGILASPRITIVTGTTVTVNGSQTLLVYTNAANYSRTNGGNGTQTGSFAGPRAPTAVQPFDSAPAFSAVAAPPVASAAKVAAGPTLAGVTAATGNTPARGPAAPRLLRQGRTVLLVEPVVQSRAVAQQNRAVLQNLAVTPQAGRLAPTDRALRPRNQKDRTAAVVRPVAAGGGAGLQR